MADTTCWEVWRVCAQGTTTICRAVAGAPTPQRQPAGQGPQPRIQPRSTHLAQRGLREEGGEEQWGVRKTARAASLSKWAHRQRQQAWWRTCRLLIMHAGCVWWGHQPPAVPSQHAPPPAPHTNGHTHSVGPRILAAPVGALRQRSIVRGPSAQQALHGSAARKAAPRLGALEAGHQGAGSVHKAPA